MVRGRAINYSADELAWIEENSSWPRAMLHRYFVMFFGRDEVTVDALKALCLRKGWKTGRTGCFPKGSIPPNKGKFGYHAPGSEKGWFAKGSRPANYRGPGHETLSKDGYVMVVVRDGVRYPSCPQRTTRPVLKHRLLWEQCRGPIPKGHVLKCLDGDRTNCEPDNWVMIPMGMLPFLNGGRACGGLPAYDEAPAEMRPAILAAARLKYEIRKKAGKVIGRKRRKDTALPAFGPGAPASISTAFAAPSCGSAAGDQ